MYTRLVYPGFCEVKRTLVKYIDTRCKHIPVDYLRSLLVHQRASLNHIKSPQIKKGKTTNKPEINGDIYE